jgi:hypothetical protein
MVIEYLSGDVIPQSTVASEMKTDPVKGITYAKMTRIPFDRLGYAEVREAHATVDELKEQNSHGYVSIILIWFDTDHVKGHYVVVVGYNATGILVNPWATDWAQPESRKTGKDAFISNELLADLWAGSDHWVLEVPYPAAQRVSCILRWCSINVVLCITIGVITAVVIVVVSLLFLTRRRRTSARNIWPR